MHLIKAHRTSINLKPLAQQIEILYIGSFRQIDAQLSEESNITVTHDSVGGLRKIGRAHV